MLAWPDADNASDLSGLRWDTGSSDEWTHGDDARAALIAATAPWEDTAAQWGAPVEVAWLAEDGGAEQELGAGAPPAARQPHAGTDVPSAMTGAGLAATPEFAFEARDEGDAPVERSAGLHVPEGLEPDPGLWFESGVPAAAVADEGSATAREIPAAPTARVDATVPASAGSVEFIGYPDEPTVTHEQPVTAVRPAPVVEVTPVVDLSPEAEAAAEAEAFAEAGLVTATASKGGIPTASTATTAVRAGRPTFTGFEATTGGAPSAAMAATIEPASDLWSLVAESPDTEAKPGTSEPSRLTTALLSLLVALVIVALVVGFLVMFTNLL
jgi:hypothetical protein